MEITKKKSEYDEPVIEIMYIDENVILYTSTTGDSGDVWQEFDDEWL